MYKRLFLCECISVGVVVNGSSSSISSSSITAAAVATTAQEKLSCVKEGQEKCFRVW